MILYRLALLLLAPLVLIALLWRVLRGRETWGDFAERLGRAPTLPQEGGEATIWLHAASNGELTAARPLIDALRQQATDSGLALRFAVTTNSLSGRDLARRIGGLRASLAPVDMRWALRRFLRANRPDLLLNIEAELWPNRLGILQEIGIPVAVAGGRMSVGSARSWSRFAPPRRLMAQMLGVPAWLAPLDRDTGLRLKGLGLNPAALAGPLDLKAVAAVPGASGEPSAPQGRGRTVLAASTHEGDEDLILDALAPLMGEVADLRLILAPRHPRRADEIAKSLTQGGLGYARRSTGGELADLGPDRPVLLADTLGEMGSWYAEAGLCVIGGSFSDRGGHTPYEPIASGCAVLHGPDMANFRSAAEALRPSEAETSAEGLAERLRGLLTGGADLGALARIQAGLIPCGGTRLQEAAGEILTILKADS